MLLSPEEQAVFRAQLPSFDLLLPLLPELPGIVDELLQHGRSARLAARLAHTQAAALGPANRAALAQALAALRRTSLRCGHYGLAWHLLQQLASLLAGPLALTAPDLAQLFDGAGIQADGLCTSDLQDRHVLDFLHQWLAQATRAGRGAAALPPVLAERLRHLLTLAAGAAPGGYCAKDLGRLRARVLAVLSQYAPEGLPVGQFDGGDAFGRALNEFAAALPPAAARTRPWLALLHLLGQAGAGKPSARQAQALAAASAALDPTELRAAGRAWLELLAHCPLAGFQPGGTAGAAPYLLAANLPAAKALVAALAPLADAPLLQLLADLAARTLRQQPGAGPLSLGLGNAALLALSQHGLPGVTHLARLRPVVAQENTKALLTNYLTQATEALGLGAEEIEDLSVPDCGLRDGQARFAFGDYEATLALRGNKAELSWARAGKVLKALPAAVRAAYPAGLQALKAVQAQAQQTWAAQRERLDRSFLAGRRIGGAQFAARYLGHGLLGPLVRGLIWRLHRPGGTHLDALCLPEGGWLSRQGQPLPADALGLTAAVQLWHPVLAPAEEVLAWRQLLEDRQLRQPLKQAFREVYLLTPPEERTRTYSNRMAAHILRQHQFCALARGRGWQFRLLGTYDKGYDTSQATLLLPALGLVAAYWVSEVNADGAHSPSGIWTYVSTDQLRFVRQGQPVPLPAVPPLVFSEVMRDADLFVGVASVGNDPLWRDNGGLPQLRNYWESYSFGELGEVAKNRRLALARLLPRLKVGQVSELRERFLVVRGQRRTYKIHLGSGNILMEPGNQYLCIVPDRAAPSPGADVFLPFEGDAMLSIILSKAQLLMHDDQLTDETILRQLARGGA